VSGNMVRTVARHMLGNVLRFAGLIIR
jgi:hypothetical protein